MVSILIVATNNYTQFVSELLHSIERCWKYTGLKIHYHIFTDRVGEVTDILQWKEISVHEIEHREWPYATLYRFHFFKRYMQEIQGDYIFYVDADTRFTALVDDILSDRVAVQHCGFVGERGSYERNPESAAYVAPHEGTMYYGGGFYGFSKAEFIKFNAAMVEMVEADRKKGITPEHNDEAYMNRYFIDNPPTLVLSPSYHYPENHPYIYSKWGGKDKYQCKLLLLNKNHKQIR